MIKVNEKRINFEKGITLHQLKERFKPNADILIYNGFPLDIDKAIEDGDEIIFIKRGEIPSKEELESLMVSRHTPGVHDKVKKSVVGIAGLGGLGTVIAVALARIGIGKLIIADFDVVEPSNLNRQQYFINQIGKLKVEATKENLSMINPYVEIETHNIVLNYDNVADVFKETKILVEAFDRADMKAMLVNSFLEHYPDRYMVCASGLAGYNDANTIQARKYGKGLYIIGDTSSAAQPGRGLMAPRVGVAASHQANKVLEIILGEEL
ncbi:MAG: sulfur carrier protein ThiS adenylyltransferase ThiF [Spirochaetota bacterium]|nr:sulfur carrier protein ThiS adenylyltransferase ThiF [Spirochaetota bacterium]